MDTAEVKYVYEIYISHRNNLSKPYTQWDNIMNTICQSIREKTGLKRSSLENHAMKYGIGYVHIAKIHLYLPHEFSHDEFHMLDEKVASIVHKVLKFAKLEIPEIQEYIVKTSYFHTNVNHDRIKLIDYSYHVF